MRLLIATGIYPPDIGGPATYAAQLFEHLPKRGIEVKVATYADEKVKSQKSKVKTTTQNSKILSVSRSIPKGLRHLLYFSKVLRHGWKADVIYALDTVSAGLPAAIAAKILRKPFVVKVVGDYAWEQWQVKTQNAKRKSGKINDFIAGAPSRRRAGDGQNYNSKFKTIEEFQNERQDFFTEMRRLIQKWVVRNAHVVITPSEYLKNIIAGWGIAREKIKVIPNAVIVPEALPSKEEARSRLGLEGVILLSAGRLVPWKGFRALIAMMAQIKNEVPEARLLIIGSGPEEEPLKAYVRDNELEGRVSFIGSVPRDTLWAYLAAGDIFLLNTAYEGFSHQLIEAMSAGIPVVTTAVGGNPEIIEDGIEGLLVPYNDAETLRRRIVFLLQDKKRSAEIRERAKKKAAQFSLERMLTETVRVLQNL
jgi:glycosyltransferase involved in cell wall biosynthesis